MRRTRRDDSSKLNLRTETLRKLADLTATDMQAVAGGGLKPRYGDTARTDGYCCS